MGEEEEERQRLCQMIPISPARINPYRIIVLLRLVVLAFFLRHRILTPSMDGYSPLWLISVICDIWFAFTWILDQSQKCFPVLRETQPHRLSLRFESDDSGQPSCNKLAPVDLFVSSVDPFKEPPIITANTVLSILAVDYPADKVSCYVSDDGASMLLFDTLSETSEFARKWAPFCKKHCIEPRAPEFYFSQKLEYYYLMNKSINSGFVKERNVMKREYEEFKVRINALVAKELKKNPSEEGWVMKDGTPWPGNITGDHPAIIEVFLGSDQRALMDVEGIVLPRLVYISREKRPGFNHHRKAGAMNALVRASAVLTNAPFILNLDCDHYVNNSKALREAMCFHMDPRLGKKLCFVQFPQRFYGVDSGDRYANHNSVFFDSNLKGLDGIQGPMYVGTGCVFNRRALYGYDPPVSTGKPQKMIFDCGCSWFFCCCQGGGNMIRKNYNFKKRFGPSQVFIASTTVKEDGGVFVVPDLNTITDGLIEEAIHVISCDYEEKTEWGEEIAWIYGSVTEDILTGFKMHCRGWKSVYCIPERAAFKGTAPINLSDRLHQVLRWSLGSVEIFMSRHCPVWYGWRGGKLRLLQRLAYINMTSYPFTSIPLLAYCTFPAVCLLTGKFNLFHQYSSHLWYLSALFLSMIATAILEIRWSKVSIRSFWRVEQFWMIGGVSAYIFAVVHGLLKLLVGVDTKFTVTSKKTLINEDEKDDGFRDLYLFKWTALLIPPTMLIVLNIAGVVVGVSEAMKNNIGFGSWWGILLGRLFLPVWVILHLIPFLKGLMGRHNITPTMVLFVLCVSLISMLKDYN